MEKLEGALLCRQGEVEALIPCRTLRCAYILSGVVWAVFKLNDNLISRFTMWDIYWGLLQRYGLLRAPARKIVFSGETLETRISPDP